MLQNLTLQGGFANGSGVSAWGGAIFNQGVLDLNGVTVQNNLAEGSTGQSAEGGGIYSNATMTLEGGTIVQNNVAEGGEGNFQSKGGAGLGGGVYVAGGTASLTNITLSGNTAQGGRGGTGEFPGRDGSVRQCRHRRQRVGRWAVRGWRNHYTEQGQSEKRSRPRWCQR